MADVTRSPRTGGTADKLGNRYEALWTVRQLIDVLRGDADAITVEPYEESAESAEFILERPDGRREFHSVKRRPLGEAQAWSWAQLSRERGRPRSLLLDLAKHVFDDPKHEARFISPNIGAALTELTDRAATASAPADLTSPKYLPSRLMRDFAEYVLPACSDDQDSAFDFLRRCSFHAEDELRLLGDIESWIEVLVYAPAGGGDSTTVRLLLAELILTSLGRRATADDVWQVLAAHGYRPLDWAHDATVQDAIAKANTRYQSLVESSLIQGVPIERSAVAEIVNGLTAVDSAGGAILVGPAGQGKSCVLAQVVRAAEQSGIPVLAFKLDSVGEVTTARQIGAVLDLPLSPVQVVAGMAEGAVGLICIDQIDAVATLAPRGSSLWTALNELLEEAQRYPHVRVVIACRTFDLESDPRLKQLEANRSFRRQALGVLDSDIVAEVLAQAELNADTLGRAQRALLQTPLYLYLFLAAHEEAGPSFQNDYDLFAAYWKHLVDTMPERFQPAPDVNAAIGAVSDAISRRRSFHAPASVLDGYGNAADALTSQGVIVREGETLRFFHQAFFEYAYARGLVANGRPLLDLLLEGEQDLFRRGQVRQVLRYRRDSDRKGYLQDLSAILTDDRVRFHVQKLALDSLHSVPDPTVEEWALVRPLTDDLDLRAHGFAVVVGSVDWFDVLDVQEVWDAWLSREDEFVDAMFHLFIPEEVQAHRGAYLVTFLRPRLGSSERWTRRIHWLLGSGRFHRTPELVDLFLEAVDAGVFDEAGWRSLWSTLYTTVTAHPDVTCLGIERWLRLRLRLAVDEGLDDPFQGDRWDDSAQYVIGQAAALVPRIFVAACLPVVLEIASTFCQARPDEEAALPSDKAWPYRIYGAKHAGAHHLLLEALATALNDLAQEAPDEFRTLFTWLAEVKLETAAFLLLRTATTAASELAERYAEYLLTTPGALEIGYLVGGGGPSVTRDAIRAIAPHLDDEMFGRLEGKLMDYTFAYERRKPRHRGFLLMSFLRALPHGRLSAAARRRLGELERKFPDAPAEAFEPRAVEAVGCRLTSAGDRPKSRGRRGHRLSDAEV